MSDWQGIVSAETNRQDFFELKSKRLQTRMMAAAVIVVVVGIGTFFVTQNFIDVYKRQPKRLRAWRSGLRSIKRFPWQRTWPTPFPCS